VAEGSEVLRDNAHTIAIDQLIPRIAERNHTALEVVQTPIYFFSKIRAGRRCSCFDINISHNTSCACCYGTGIVGGYLKYGTNLEVIDVTHPNIKSVNVLPDYRTLVWPRQLKLVDGAIEGYIETRMQVLSNIGSIDHIFNRSNEPSGTELHAYLKTAADSDWVPFTLTTLSQRLVNSWVDFRIEFKRSTVRTPSPTFKMFYIRYNRIEPADQVIIANIPKTAKSILLSDMGLDDDWERQKFWLDNTIRSVTTEDFVAHLDSNTRWKIYTVNETAPQDLLLSWDLETSLVLHYEATQRVPI
jgi:hypothetical protein